MGKPIEKTPSEEKNKIVAGVAYLFNFLGLIGIIFIIIFYFLTKNTFARIHLLQSIFFNLVLSFLFIMFPIVSFWNYAIPITFILLAIYAFLGEGFEISFIKKFVEGQSDKAHPR